MSFEPIDGYEVTLVHPAVDMDGEKAYIGSWILSRIHKKRGTRIQHAHYVITSDREMIKSKKLGAAEIEDDIFLKFQPVKVEATWSKRGIDQFLNGYTPDPLEVFHTVRNEYLRYLDFYDPRHYDLLTLWTIGTYFYTIFNAYPYLYVGGIKRTGKTKCLTSVKCMAFNAVMSSDMTASTLFRLIQNGRCTVLVDETESLKDPNKRQQFRQLILQGYKKYSGSAYRSERFGKYGRITPTGFEVYSPKIFANITGLDDVLEDRCLPIIMRRSAKKGVVNAEIDAGDQRWQNIRDMLYAFALSHWKLVKKDSGMSLSIEGVSSRDLELWRPPIAIARLLSVLSMSKSISKHKNSQKLASECSPMSPRYSSLYAELVDLAKHKIKVRHAREMTEEYSMILTKVLVREVISNDDYKCMDLRDKMTEFLEEGEEIKSRTVSNLLTRLGFEEKKKKHGRTYYKLTVKSVHDLANGMGLDIEEVLEEKRKEEEEARRKAEEEGEEPTAPVKI